MGADTNLQAATNLLLGLTEAGVTRAVISPGSRNTPLILAADQRPEIKAWVQIDERSAAFFALGMAKAERQPVLLICTSGTAAGNWLPAVIEANHRGIPLLLLTADRPWELQQCGANQTIDQTRLFGSQVRAFHQVMAEDIGHRQLVDLGHQVAGESLGPDPGPVHINIGFREPLVPEHIPGAPGVKKFAAQPWEIHLPTAQLLPLIDALGGGEGVLVCGDGDYPTAFPNLLSRLSKELGAPILADPLSNLRFGLQDRTRLVTGYDWFLQDPAVHRQLRPDWMLRFGATPTSKALQAYLGQLEDCQHYVVTDRGNWPNPVRTPVQFLHASPDQLCRQLLENELSAKSPVTPNPWLQLEELTLTALSGLSDHMPTEGQVIRNLLKALPDNSHLFVGNSLPIRYIDSYSGSGAQTLKFFGNRGASGIDGCVSTALGLGQVHDGLTVALLGDLSFVHDLNGLGIQPRPDLLLILFNNNGGGIFRHLPQSRLESYNRYWKTASNLDFSHVAALHRLSYHHARNAEEFQLSLHRALSLDGVRLIEVTVDDEDSADQHRRIRGLLRSDRLRQACSF